VLPIFQEQLLARRACCVVVQLALLSGILLHGVCDAATRGTAFFMHCLCCFVLLCCAVDHHELCSDLPQGSEPRQGHCQAQAEPAQGVTRVKHKGPRHCSMRRRVCAAAGAVTTAANVALAVAPAEMVTSPLVWQAALAICGPCGGFRPSVDCGVDLTGSAWVATSNRALHQAASKGGFPSCGRSSRSS
jgi:hypothetical protein